MAQAAAFWNSLRGPSGNPVRSLATALNGRIPPSMATSNTKGTANPKGVVDILLNRKLVTESQLQPLIEEARKNEKLLQQIIVDKKLLDKTVVLKALSEEWRIKAVNLTDIEVDMDVVKVITETTARRHKEIGRA